MGARDGSDRLVSTPGAPNIRIVPSIVPVESGDLDWSRVWWSLSLTDRKYAGHRIKCKGGGVQELVKCPQRPDLPILYFAQL
jgi:hypothetical protein